MDGQAGTNFDLMIDEDIRVKRIIGYHAVTTHEQYYFFIPLATTGAGEVQ
jgi:hypothetical protein